MDLLLSKGATILRVHGVKKEAMECVELYKKVKVKLNMKYLS
jgi:hypothetical protein